MTHTFTSLNWSIEKLLEAEYFLVHQFQGDSLEFQFNLNAFLSACRSVTFVLQSSMSNVDGFVDWYGEQQNKMANDTSMRFFVEARNISQKAGPVGYVGLAQLNSPKTHKQGVFEIWQSSNDFCAYRFVAQRLPDELLGVDIQQACAEHLGKLAHILGHFLSVFPFDSSPATALTPEGMQKLGYTMRDVERLWGLPEDYLKIDDTDWPEEGLKHFSDRCEPSMVGELKRIADMNFRKSGETFELPEQKRDTLLDSLQINAIESLGSSFNPKFFSLQSIGEQIQRVSNKDDTDN